MWASQSQSWSPEYCDRGYIDGSIVYLHFRNEKQLDPELIIADLFYSRNILCSCVKNATWNSARRLGEPFEKETPVIT